MSQRTQLLGLLAVLLNGCGSEAPDANTATPEVAERTIDSGTCPKPAGPPNAIVDSGLVGTWEAAQDMTLNLPANAGVSHELIKSWHSFHEVDPPWLKTFKPDGEYTTKGHGNNIYRYHCKAVTRNGNQLTIEMEEPVVPELPDPVTEEWCIIDSDTVAFRAGFDDFWMVYRRIEIESK